MASVFVPMIVVAIIGGGLTLGIRYVADEFEDSQD